MNAGNFVAILAIVFAASLPLAYLLGVEVGKTRERDEIVLQANKNKEETKK